MIIEGLGGKQICHRDLVLPNLSFVAALAWECGAIAFVRHRVWATIGDDEWIEAFQASLAIVFLRMWYSIWRIG